MTPCMLRPLGTSKRLTAPLLFCVIAAGSVKKARYSRVHVWGQAQLDNIAPLRCRFARAGSKDLIIQIYMPFFGMKTLALLHPVSCQGTVGTRLYTLHTYIGLWVLVLEQQVMEVLVQVDSGTY